jgi:hypothetical protein
MLKQGNGSVDDHGSLVVENDGCLDCALVLHGLQALSPLVELEGLIDDPFDLDLARVEIVNSSSLATSALSQKTLNIGGKLKTYGTCRSRRTIQGL